jgi:hypothetical protein
MLATMTTEQKWTARVEAWRASGQTARQFAEGKEYSAGGLRHWAYRLRQASEAAAVVETKPQGEVAPKEVRIARVVRGPAVTEAETPIMLEVGGVRVGVRRGFDRGALREVLDVLGGGQ